MNEGHMQMSLGLYEPVLLVKPGMSYFVPLYEYILIYIYISTSSYLALPLVIWIHL